MTYEIAYTDPIDGVSLTDAKAVIDALDTHHDPTNDIRVERGTIRWQDDGTYRVEMAFYHENTSQANISTEIDAVATVIDSLSVGPSKSEAADNVTVANRE